MPYTADTQLILDNGGSVASAQEYALTKRDKLTAAGVPILEANEHIKKRFGFDFAPDTDLTMSEAFISGYQYSVMGLGSRQKMPDKPLPENAEILDQLAHTLGRSIGDLPAGIAGLIAGGVTGASASGGIAAPVTVPGAAIGGAIAMPEVMRYLLIEQITKGQIITSEQFFARFAEALSITAKAEATGYVSAATGGAAAGLVSKAAPALTSAVGTTATKAITSVASDVGMVGGATVTASALEGRIPTADDLIIGAAMIAGAKTAAPAARYLTGKAKAAYVDSGFNIAKYIEKPLEQIDVEYVRSKNHMYPKGVSEHGKQVLKIKDSFEASKAPKETPSFYEPQNVVDQMSKKFWETLFKPARGKGYTQIFDGLIKLQQISDDPVIQRIYQDARKIPNASKKAKRAMHHGLFNLKTGEKIGPSLREVLEPIKDYSGFEKYLRAKQSKSMILKQQRPTIKDSKESFAGLAKEAKSPEFKTAHDTILKLREQLILEGERSGYFSKKAANNLRKNNDSLLPISHKLAADKPNWAQLTQADQLVNPVESVISDTYKLYRQFEINEVKAKAFHELSRVPTRKRPLQANEVEVALEQDKSGKTLRALTAEETGQLTIEASETALMDFRHEGKYVKVAMDKGVVKALESLEPKEVNLVVKALKPFATATRIGTVLDPGFWWRMTGADLMLAPYFSKNNFIPIVDHLGGAGTLIGQWLNKKNPNLFKGSAAVYDEAVSKGAFGAAYVQQDISNTMLRELYSHDFANVVNVLKATDLADVKSLLNPLTTAKYAGRGAAYATRKTVNTLAGVTEAFDLTARLGEYRAAKRRGKSPAAAAFDAREVNLDFTRMGTSITALNMITAFTNPSLQSVAKFASLVKNQPTTALTRGIVGITLPAFFLAMNDQDILHNSPDSDAAKNILARSQVQSDMYFNFINADGDTVKFRVPFEVGAVFKTPAEAFAKYLYDNSEDKNLLSQMWEDDNFKTIAESFVPPIMPNAITPLVEPYINYSLFRDQPIVAGWAERLSPQLRSDSASTQLSKELSIQLNGFSPISDSKFWERYTSPKAIDHLFTAWTGGAGKTVLTIADQLLQVSGVVPKDFKDWENPMNIPVLNSFYIRNGHFTGAAKPLVKARERLLGKQEVINSIKQLYKTAEEYGAIHKQLLGLGHDATQQDIKNAQESLYMVSKPIRAIGKLDTVIREISGRTKYKPEELNTLFSGILMLRDSTKVMQAIQESKGQFTPRLKDTLIDELRWQQISVANEINIVLDTFDKK